MGFKKFTLIVFLFIAFGLPAIAQQDSVSLTTIVSKTEKLTTEHPFEKVYIHFDKPYYAVGDTIWLKAYLTIGPRHQLSGLSGSVYVDVIGDQDTIVQSLKLWAISGVAFGDITLSPQLYKQGNYHIRAYTNWMRNFGPDYFFNKTISIGNVFDNVVAPEISFTKTKNSKGEAMNAKILYHDRDGDSFANKKVTWEIQNDDETISKGKGVTDSKGVLAVTFPINQSVSYDAAKLVTVIDRSEKKQSGNTFPLKRAFALADVQFFPEGGELITGVRSKIAFKAVNPDGLGVDVTGSVTDNAGNEVTGFTSKHAGMGIFALQPEAGKTYKATVTFPDGAKGVYDLPNVLNDGIDLAVNNNDPDNLYIKIASNAVYFQQYQNKTFYIIAQSGGTVYYTGLAALRSQVYSASVPKSKFPTGVLQLTLLTSAGEPLSERLVFIQHNDALNISMKSNLQEYTVRQHVTMAVSAKNNALPAQGTFSVAVIDESKVPQNEDAETTILTSVLLTSDLRGYIEKPNYYFSSPDEDKRADLDILLLTQGYRRFSYTDIIADKYPPLAFSFDHGIDITGTLRTGTGVPVYRGNVIMNLSDRNTSQTVVTDAEGKFKFPGIFIRDSTKVVLSARVVERNSELMIMADVPPPQPLVKNYSNPDAILNIDSALKVYLQNSKKIIEGSHTLKEVVIRGTRTNRVVHAEYTTLIGLPMDADQVLGPDMLKECSADFEGCVMGRVLGLWLRDGQYYIKSAYDAGNHAPVKFFVNGLAVDDFYLSKLNPADIVSVEVYFTDGVSHLMSFYQCNGIISITTKTRSFNEDQKSADLSALVAQTGNVTIMPKGFYKARIFYSPKYNTQENAVPQGTDRRSTVYWNPNITTDKDGNATFDFYNADGRGTYRAVIEGIDLDGNLGRQVFRYKVN